VSEYLAASAPPMVNPEMVTVLPVPMLLSEKTPVAEAVFNVTVSPETTPKRAAPAVFIMVAVEPSYSLLFAMTLLTVKALVAILALRLACWVKI